MCKKDVFLILYFGFVFPLVIALLFSHSYNQNHYFASGCGYCVGYYEDNFLQNQINNNPWKYTKNNKGGINAWKHNNNKSF